MDHKKTKIIASSLIFLIAGFGWFYFLSKKTVISIESKQPEQASQQVSLPEKTEKIETQKPANSDIEPQKPLQNPPETIKAVYFTSWSGATESRINYLLDLKKTTQINSVVIDIKDYSGLIAYNIDLPEAEKYRTKEIRISKINSLIKKLHDNGIYIIARITAFQDPALAKARPDLAVKRKNNASSTPPYPTWYDNKKLAWLDPGSKEVWDYIVSIAKDAAGRGFDEINFDYIRFPSDGDLSVMYFSFSDPKIPKHQIIKNFFQYLRESLPDIKISADIFGLVTINKDDMGIGQVLEDIYENFDYVCPMVYPSHYYTGTLGYKNPADHPYEVIRYSMDNAFNRLLALKYPKTAASATSSPQTDQISPANPKIRAKLRPWLQDFDLGAIYTADMVKSEIKAVSDALKYEYSGFMLWNPSNVYTKEAVQ